MVLVTVMEAKYFLTLSPYYSFRVRFPLVSLAAIFVMHTTLFPNKWPLTFKPHSFPNLSPSQLWFYLCRAVKKFLSSRLIMNSRQLWNLHSWGHFEIWSLRNDISRGFQEVFCTVNIMLFRPTQDWEHCHRDVPVISRHHTVPTFHRSKPLNMHSQTH